MKAIETMEQWRVFSEQLSSGGYRIWQMQYDAQHPEGYHTWFCASGKPEVEIVTRNDAVKEAIPRYKPK